MGPEQGGCFLVQRAAWLCSILVPDFLQPPSMIRYAKREGLGLFFMFLLKLNCQFEIKTLLAVWLWPEFRCE